MGDHLKLLFNPFFDGRYEDMRRGWQGVVFRDFVAGLVVAMVALPLAIGFATASGLHPVHGIIGGAVAGLVGALFGGSKYQVYGPTAAFIPIISGVMAKYGGGQPDLLASDYATGYGFLILCSALAGVLLALMGMLKLGVWVTKVPHSIVVGFTIGIALTILLTQIGDILGLKENLPHPFFEKVQAILSSLGQVNPWSIAVALGAFLTTKYLLRFSIYIPGPLIALGAGFVLTQTVLADAGLVTSKDEYGPIPTEDFFKFTPPSMPAWTGETVLDLVYFAVAITLVASIESLLCVRMADRIADNQGTPYNPNKELFGQGMVNLVTPMFNGFPHTGALARTATNIKVGGMTPLAGILKCWLKLGMAYFLATSLDLVPMACIGGILAYVAINMVNRHDVESVLRKNGFHAFLMIYTALVVLVADFLSGALSALALYLLLRRHFDHARQMDDDGALAAAGTGR